LTCCRILPATGYFTASAVDDRVESEPLSFGE
jgi:hypothetical protein